MWMLWMWAVLTAMFTVLGLLMMLTPVGLGDRVVGARLTLLGWAWPLIIPFLFYMLVMVAFNRSPLHPKERYTL